MTNSEQNDLEKLLKDNLSDKTAIVPDFVWDRIEEELFPEKKRRGFFWLLFGGIGCIGCIAAVYFVFVSGDGATNRIVAKQNEKNQVKTIASSKRSGGKNGLYAKNEEHPADLVAGDVSAIANVEHENMTARARISRSGKKILSAEKETDGNTFIVDNLDRGSKKEDESKEEAKTSVPGPAQGNDSSVVKNNSIQNEFSPENLDSTLSETTDPVADTSIPQEAHKRFALSVYGGSSLYDMAVFKDYFVSGQLSNRSFKSSGFELGAGFSFNVSHKIGVYTQVAFNQKNTSFEYNLAITESQYFDQVLNGELIAIEEIVENGVDNCFITSTQADYQVNSLLLSLGSIYEVARLGKFSLGADVRFSANLNSAMKMSQLTALQIPQPDPERFNVFRIGAGLNLDYRFSNSMSLGIAPMYHLQFNPKPSFYARTLKELILPVNFKFYF